MSLYKYMTADGALRYLRNLFLRITPPDQFNDPFEMRPTYTLNPKDLMEQAPGILREELVATFSKEIKAKYGGNTMVDAEVFSDRLAAFLMNQLSSEDEREFLLAISVVGASDATEKLTEFRSQFDSIYRQVLESAKAQIPAFGQLAQSAIHSTLPRVIGVLCLCASRNNPLMWAHYADSHKGALLEFDMSAPCFNRRRSEVDDLGHLRRVRYSDSRPALDTTSNSEELFASIALTKGLEWAYEQEHRMLWPLAMADHRVDGGEKPIHLLEVPVSSLLSVTLGCRSSDAFEAAVIRSVSELKSPANIGIRRAVVDENSFTLNYINVE